MKALVLAAAIATAELQEAPLRRSVDRDAARRGRAERKRYTEQDLAEALGAMEATPEPPAPLAALPEPDFIRWEPDPHPQRMDDLRSIETELGHGHGGRPLAA